MIHVNYNWVKIISFLTLIRFKRIKTTHKFKGINLNFEILRDKVKKMSKLSQTIRFKLQFCLILFVNEYFYNILGGVLAMYNLRFVANSIFYF